MSSPARISANRANALRSTGPRTSEGKAASSRNALSHGAYATDDTLLAALTTPLSVPDAEQTHSRPSHEALSAQPDLTMDADGPALLASFTSHYNPAGPAETLLVRRIVAATLRIDLLERAMDALLELGERRALVDHLAETYAINEPTLQVRDAPNYAAMLRRYDGTAELPPDFDPALDPDPALFTLAYTLSSPRAALLMRHEATAERRLHVAMRELHRLQAERRAEEKERNKAIAGSPTASLPTRPLAVPPTRDAARARSGVSSSHPNSSRQYLDTALDAFLPPASTTTPRETPPAMHPVPDAPPRENAFAYPTQATPRENEANTMPTTLRPQQHLRPTSSTVNAIGRDRMNADPPLAPLAYHE